MKTRILILLTSFIPLISFAAYGRQPLESNESAALAATENAELRTAAPKSGPICSGGDDTVALQALLNHGNPEMTVVEIPATPTGCTISGPLQVYSNTHVIQNGLLKFNLSSYTWPTRSTQVGMYTVVQNSHDVIIEGSGVLDGGHPVFTTLASGCCMGGIVTAGSDLAAYDANVRDLTIRGLTIRNISHWPLEIDDTTNVRVDGLTIHNSGNSAAVGHGSENAIVTNLRLYNIADICFAFYRGVENGLIANTNVDRCMGGGIYVFSDWPACVGPPQFSKNVVMNNNIAAGQNSTFGVGGIGVLGLNTNGEGSESASLTFSLAHSHYAEGMSMTPVRHSLIAGNMAHSQGPGGYSSSLALRGAKGTLVSGNSYFSEGSGSMTGYGVYAATFPASPVIPLSMCNSFVPALPAVTVERLAVLDNYFYDSAPVLSMLNAIIGSVGQPEVVAGNTYAPMLGAADAMIYAPGSVNTDNDVQP